MFKSESGFNNHFKLRFYLVKLQVSADLSLRQYLTCISSCSLSMAARNRDQPPYQSLLQYESNTTTENIMQCHNIYFLRPYMYTVIYAQ